MAAAVRATTVVPSVMVTAGGVDLACTVDNTTYPGYVVADFFVTKLPAGETGIESVQGEIDAFGGTFYVASKAATITATFQYDTTLLGLDAGTAPPYTAWNFATANGVRCGPGMAAPPITPPRSSVAGTKVLRPTASPPAQTSTRLAAL